MITFLEILGICFIVFLIAVFLSIAFYLIFSWLTFPRKMRKELWELLHQDPENICRSRMRNHFEFYVEDYITKEMQEYVIQKRPDLINKIPHLRFGLEEKYKDELNLSRIDI